MTYDLPHATLDVIRSDIMGRSCSTNYDDFLASVILRGGILT